MAKNHVYLEWVIWSVSYTKHYNFFVIFSVISFKTKIVKKTNNILEVFHFCSIFSSRFFSSGRKKSNFSKNFGNWRVIGKNGFFCDLLSFIYLEMLIYTEYMCKNDFSKSNIIITLFSSKWRYLARNWKNKIFHKCF